MSSPRVMFEWSSSRRLLFGWLVFGRLLFGWLLFGRLVFGWLVFGRLLFGRLLFGWLSSGERSGPRSGGVSRWRFVVVAGWLAIGVMYSAPASSAGQLAGQPAAHVSAQPTAERSIVTYTVPVHGPVIDPFRPPAHFGGPGNRGLEFGNPLWAPVVAAADGRVTFAGPVFGNGTVVVEHADGVRTTYNGLAELWVGAGQTVSQLDGLGMAGTNVHFGALRGNVYLDPQILIDASQSQGTVRLVPVGD